MNCSHCLGDVIAYSRGRSSYCNKIHVGSPAKRSVASKANEQANERTNKQKNNFPFVRSLVESTTASGPCIADLKHRWTFQETKSTLNSRALETSVWSAYKLIRKKKRDQDQMGTVLNAERALNQRKRKRKRKQSSLCQPRHHFFHET